MVLERAALYPAGMGSVQGPMAGQEPHRIASTIYGFPTTHAPTVILADLVIAEVGVLPEAKAYPALPLATAELLDLPKGAR